MKIFLLLLNAFAVLAAKSDDLITNLPGLSQLPSYKMYSGYLDATSQRHFHYWFVESQSDPANDPVVLWLNGGPGCSSLDGLLSENGPLHVNDDGATLYNNPYSWNKIANVLYLESPAGVGYSYDETGNVKTDDDQVSLENYQALQDFFKKFPEFLKNPFFITGESYGGIYVPTLSVRIVQGTSNINFQGLAVGNGLSSSQLNDDSLVLFAYYHGLFGSTLQSELITYCCNGTSLARETCQFSKSEIGDCQDAVEEVMQYVYNSGLNTYALYLDCYGGDDNAIAQRYRHDMNMLFRNLSPERRAKIFNRKLLSRQPHVGLRLTPPCINATAVTSWLNREDVRTALHIEKSLKKWAVCSEVVSATYGRIYNDMTPQYNQLLKDNNLSILIYNGDTDMACNFLGDEWFVDDLGLKSTRSHVPWYVDGQVAGFVKVFDKLTYTTIRGAGHMVPQWAPKYAFVMFEKFIHKKPFNN
ncbi:unnamed protein product [Clavelina lepadiformis]|uniref:Carboxypeptidase n=1 Tax=Clavelina lepadiformis TaxID=159417 RepID=A0ABP0G278_CLALP